MSFFIIKSRITDLKNVPNAQVGTDLLHEISHYYKISYIAFLQGVKLPHPPLKIQRST